MIENKTNSIKRMDFRIYINIIRCLSNYERPLYMRELYLKTSTHYSYIPFLAYLKYLHQIKVITKNKNGAKTFYELNKKKKNNAIELLRYYDKVFN